MNISTAPGTVLATVGSMLPGLVLADAAAQKTAAGVDPVSVGSLMQVLMGLVLILALIIGFAFLLRRMGYWQVNSNGALKVIGGISMGPRERIVLLQVGNKQLVLGVTPGRIQALCEMEERVEINQEPGLPASSFQQKLMQFVQRSNPDSVQ